MQTTMATPTRSFFGTDLDDELFIAAGPVSFATSVFAGGGNDTVVGAAGDLNLLYGEAGDDWLVGGSLQNTLDGGDGADTLDASAGAAAGLNGGAGNDFLLGSATGASTLDGGAGSDTMVGGAGEDAYLVDSIGDVVVESLATRPGATASTDDRVTALIDYTLPANVERLVLGGTTEPLTGTGNGQSNTMWGNAGVNLLRGLGGNDTLYGGAEADVLQGGAGNEHYVLGSTLNEVVEAAGGGNDRIYTVHGYTLAAGVAVETIELGGAGNVDAIGNEFDNLLIGNLGNNRLEGGGGFDIAAFNSTVNISSAVTVTLGGAGPNAVGGGNDTLVGIEGVIGSTFADLITGDGGANLLDGHFGADTLAGGAGADRYLVNATTDQVIETSTLAGEIDTVESTASTWTLGANLETLLLGGTAAINGSGNTLANRITGNGAANQLKGEAGNDTLTGGAGSDTLTGGTGNDSLVGGEGADLYVVDSAQDVIQEAGTTAGEIDRVAASLNWSLGSGLEQLTLTGGARQGTGNSAANTLNGTSGDDTLDGASGADTLLGSTGNDLYLVDHTSDVIGESTVIGGGTDGVRSSVSWTLGLFVENLQLTGSSGTRGTGNGSANTIGGNTGANLLSGDAGNDSLSGGGGNDTLDGGSGNDTLLGGDGNDTLIGGTGADRIEATGGADVVVLTSSSGADVVAGFTSGTDDLRLSMLTLRIGDGDTAVENAFTRATPGSFSTASELVIFQQNVASMTTTGAAAAIGSATAAYTVGAARLFVLDNGVTTTVYRFVAADADAAVEAAELTIIATLSGTAATATGDYLFGA
jgi:Ca2+-binding RTX toxin-like protein